MTSRRSGSARRQRARDGECSPAASADADFDVFVGEQTLSVTLALEQLKQPLLVSVIRPALAALELPLTAMQRVELNGAVVDPMRAAHALDCTDSNTLVVVLRDEDAPHEAAGGRQQRADGRSCCAPPGRRCVGLALCVMLIVAAAGWQHRAAAERQRRQRLWVPGAQPQVIGAQALGPQWLSEEAKPSEL